VNFMEQRASFQITTISQDEYFKINRIVIFSKQVYTSYPGDTPPPDLAINPLVASGSITEV